MLKPIIRKILRPFKAPVVSLTRRLLEESGVDGQLQAITCQLDDLKRPKQFEVVKVSDPRWSDLALPVLNVARQVREQVHHPLAHDLAVHYSHCIDLFRRHAGELSSASDLRFQEDDGSLDYVKSLGAYVPGNDTEPAAGSREYPLAGLLDDPDCGVFLVVGQSNAANHGDIPYRPKSEVYTLNFMSMHCCRADDPLSGSSGMGGSIWSRLGDQLVEAGVYRKVLFVPLAFGGTFARDWIHGGSMAIRLDLCLSRLSMIVGGGILPFSAVFWQQGEAEANHTDMSAETYAEYVQCLIASLRERFVVAPVFVATATLCACNSPALDNALQIRKGQHDLVMPELGVLAGPDLDQVGVDERYDGCHFSDIGLNHCASLWLDVIRNARSVLLKPRFLV